MLVDGVQCAVTGGIRRMPMWCVLSWVMIGPRDPPVGQSTVLRGGQYGWMMWHVEGMRCRSSTVVTLGGVSPSVHMIERLGQSVQVHDCSVTHLHNICFIYAQNTFR